MTARESPTESTSSAAAGQIAGNPGARVVRLRDNAVLFHFTSDHSRAPDLALQKRVWALAAWLTERRAEFSLQEIVPGMGNLLVTVSSAPVGACPASDFPHDSAVGACPASDSAHDSIAGSARSHIEKLTDDILALWPTLDGTDIPGRTVEIPVNYGGENGPDLKEVSVHTGLSIDDIITRHCAGDYRVYCLGFQPGFAYLGGLDPALATPRRATPRLAIPAGSVAIGGSQSAVYPATTPGGWQVIGRTAMRMFDPEGKQPTLLRPGDRVQFIPDVGACPASDSELSSIAGRARSHRGDQYVEVLRCGALTTVQDLGRHGYRHLGVGQSGALDPIAVRQANLLLGNPPDAAVLEFSVGPLVLRFSRDSAITLTGSGFITSNDHSDAALLPGHVSFIAAGDTVTLSKPLVPGARTYLAIAGGIDVPLVMGSRSTDINARFGGMHGRPLQTGDKLPIGDHPSDTSFTKKGIRPLSPSHVLRALPGPEYDNFTAESCESFWNQPWRINHQSNRMGLRLNGHALALSQPLELLSAGVLPGDVQVPPDGLPIVLANDAQTIGGYPRIACVIQADLWQLGHLPPCTSVYFQRVTAEEAAEAAQKQTRYLHRTRNYLQDFQE